MRIILLDYGYKISKKKGLIVIYKDGEKIYEVAPGNIDEFIINSRGVGFSSDVISFLLAHRVKLYFIRGNKLVGILNPMSGKSHVTLRKRQYMFQNTKEALHLAYNIIYSKINSQKNLIAEIVRRFRRRRKLVENGKYAILRIRETISKLVSIGPEVDRETLISIEGEAARHYWRFWSSLFKERYGFDNRRKRFEKPGDPVNKSLNLLYTLLAAKVTTYLYTWGFDPYIGILHKDSPRRPSLGMDIVEEFRVLCVDHPLIIHLLRDSPDPQDMVEDGRLKREYKKILMKIYYDNLDRRITFRHRTLPVSSQIDVQIGRLAKYLLRGSPPYQPYIYR